MLLQNLKIISEVFPNLPVASYLIEVNYLLKGCKTLLDLGCGSKSPIHLFDIKYTVGIDIDKDRIEKSEKNKIHNKYYIEDVRYISKLFKRHEFDACIALDIIEHLSKEDGDKLLKNMEKITKKIIIIFTPNGYLKQHDHKSGWKVNDFEKRGFKVLGMLGLKTLRVEKHELKFKPKVFWGFVSFLSELYTRSHPTSSAALLVYKKLSK